MDAKLVCGRGPALSSSLQARKRDSISFTVIVALADTIWRERERPSPFLSPRARPTTHVTEYLSFPILRHKVLFFSLFLFYVAKCLVGSNAAVCYGNKRIHAVCAQCIGKISMKKCGSISHSKLTRILWCLFQYNSLARLKAKEYT